MPIWMSSLLGQGVWTSKSLDDVDPNAFLGGCVAFILAIVVIVACLPDR